MLSTHGLTKSEESKIDTTILCEKLAESAKKTVNFFKSKLQSDGSYGSDIIDIACYFKSPMMFIAVGDDQSAMLVLNHINKAFMIPEGDLRTSEKLKSANGAYIEYWSYTNGWILRAANQLKLNYIFEPAFKYFAQYNLGKKLGFSTNQIKPDSSVTDVLTVSHHGLVNLEMDNLDIAISAGNFLCEAIKKQSNLDEGFYLRLKDGDVVTGFSKEQAPFYFVSKTEPNQLHFMIGYPAAYLAMLYKKTKNKEYLESAIKYLEFSLVCDKSVYACDFSHKIAWAASHIYECTGDKKYLIVIDKISDYFIAKQKDRVWFSEDVNSSFDQSAEIACWFLDIIKNINNRLTLDAEKQLAVSSHKAWTAKAVKYSAMALVAGAGLCFLGSKMKATTAGDAVAAVVKKLKGI